MTANDVVAKVKNLPPVSFAALKLVNLLEQSAVSNDEVVSALKCDNVLTAKLLRACNSPYFGLDEPVASVDQAVLILGHQQILHIVLTLAFGGAMVVPMPGYAAEASELWRHSLITATAAEIIVRNGVDMNVEAPVAFTVGLLHDMGKLVLGQILTQDIQGDIRSRMDVKQISRCDAEREVLGTDHADVGACLLRTWRLPEEIVEATAHHHHPVVEPRPLLSVVTHLANSISHVVGPATAWNGLPVQIDERVTIALDLTPEKLEGLTATVRESLDQVDQFMAMA